MAIPVNQRIDFEGIVWLSHIGNFDIKINMGLFNLIMDIIFFYIKIRMG